MTEATKGQGGALGRKFSGLLAKIRGGECVLVLGPRIAVPASVSDAACPFDEYLSARLIDDLPVSDREPMSLRSAAALYEKERDAATCRSFVQALVSDFDQHTTALHENLAALPFRLVLAATPDRMMQNAFVAKGKVDVQEACYNYCRGVASSEVLRLPSADSPIVYSLFGRHDQPESMVLNDKNLLDYLVRVIKGTPALPDAVRATLRAPTTVFLFIGFGFSNWWLRLLLKVLEVTGVENRGVSLALEDDSFDATSREHRGFFESLGIYIERRDWNALAKELATSARVAGVARPPVPAVPRAIDGPAHGRPLIFVSYASQDAHGVDALRSALGEHGISVWQDKQNLRNGQNWVHQVERIINSVDFFVFVQSTAMDERDKRGENGVYNWELKLALERLRQRPHGAVFVLHVTLGVCSPRSEPELAVLHRTAVDSRAGLDKLANDILDAYRESHGSAA